MSKSPLFQKFRNLLRAFRTSRDGNIATVFALASLPLVGFVGAAVDYSHVNAARTAMHQALDATALMLSKEASKLTTEQMNTKATAYFTALFTRPEVTDIKVTPTYTTTDGNQVVLNGSGLVKSSFMGIFGIDTVKITGSSTVTWGQARLRVALALDTTLSMKDDGKMPALQTAAKSLLTQLKNAAVKNGDVYVSIIPFANVVNVGKSNKDENWIKWKGDSDTWDENNGTGSCSKKDKNNKYPTTKAACEHKDVKGTWTWTPTKHSDWTGCVMDRNQDHDVANTAPATTDPATLFPAWYPTASHHECGEQLMALTYDWAELNKKIDALKPLGSTNQVIGLAWAFQSLTAAPFTIPPKEKNYDYSDVIILMTDGLNTEMRGVPFSTSKTTQDKIDAREKKLCENAKAAKVTIYTIHVNTGGDPSQQVLKDCASKPEMAFEIKKANQLVTVFNEIGTKLSQLRVAK